MVDGDNQASGVIDRLRQEWPALLAVAVLAAGHLYLALVEGEDFTLLGMPLIAAIVVFLVAEFGRRLF